MVEGAGSMKKEYMRSCIGITGAVLAFLVFAYCYLHPGQPDGTVDLIWPGELGSCTLQPVWVLVTDAGRFQVNAVTGRTERLTE